MFNFEYTALRIEFEGKQIQTYSYGNGKKIIFAFPSFLHIGLIYLFICKYYNNSEYKIISFDIPGWMGYSENIWDNREFSFDTCIDIALEILKAYNVKDFSILGYSFGCALAIKLANKDLSRIHKIVLISPIIYKVDSKNSSLGVIIRISKYFRLYEIFKLCIKKLLNKFKKLIVSNLGVSIFNLYISSFSNVDSRILLDSINNLFTSDFTKDINNIKTFKNILIVSSKDELYVFRKNSERLRSSLNNQNFLEIDGNHEDFVLQPNSKIVKTILEYLISY